MILDIRSASSKGAAMYKCVRVWFLTVSAKILPTCSGCSNALKYYHLSFWLDLDVRGVNNLLLDIYAWNCFGALGFRKSGAMLYSSSNPESHYWSCSVQAALSAVQILVQIVLHMHRNILNSTLNQSLLSYRQWRETNSADPILSFINPSASCRIWNGLFVSVTILFIISDIFWGLIRSKVPRPPGPSKDEGVRTDEDWWGQGNWEPNLVVDSGILKKSKIDGMIWKEYKRALTIIIPQFHYFLPTVIDLLI